MEQKNRFIKSAFNYTGGKYKLLPQLIEIFPPSKSYDNFIDLFCGGGTVAVNVIPKDKVFMNDLNIHVIEFLEVLKNTNINEIIISINNIIDKYSLSSTKSNGYVYYETNSSLGLGEYNKNAFIQLRNDYNAYVFKGKEKAIVFFLLTVYGFNNQIRFNKKGEYNLPVGKRDFNSSMEKKIKLFHRALSEGNYVFSSKDFRKFKKIKANDFLYADPPYRITNASYNENGGWNIKDDLDLFAFLDKVHEKGAKFALSNVVIHNNKENEELILWASKYNLHVLEHNYNNSNYQSTAKLTATVEVLITNY